MRMVQRLVKKLGAYRHSSGWGMPIYFEIWLVIMFVSPEVNKFVHCGLLVHETECQIKNRVI